MVRLQVTLDEREAEMLAGSAASELRDPREQARWFIRCELKQRGLLPATDQAAETRAAEGDR